MTNNNKNNHNVFDNGSVEACIKYIRNRIAYTDASLEDVLNDDTLVALVGKEQIVLCYAAAKILLNDSNT